MRDEFLGIVSHELRNQLNAINLSATLIAEEGVQEGHSAQVLKYAQRIQRTGARMNRLIGDLVDIASIDAGLLAVQRELTDPAEVLTEAVNTFQAQASANQITLTTEIEAPLSPVTLDASRILQVLINLLSNALKFTPHGGRVAVRVDCIDEQLRVAVSDTGAGIPADKLEAVFERFVQIADNDRRGMGLGLYISKCIVQGHGGRIWAESWKGQGSRFCFTIPLAADSA
jgi:signal transduction histidine kinase